MTPRDFTKNPGSPDAPIAVYVHFPWCLQKCPYCDFLSVAAERPAIPHRGYADAVLAELERRARWIGRRRLSTVFFGGGTPSLWDPVELGRVLAGIRDTFDPDDDVEVTAECNPSSLDAERVGALRSVGVNRLSIGVQGLDAERLAYLGRLHDAGGAVRAVGDALAARSLRVSVDLIFGVHGQSAAHAVHEALTIADLGVEHLSVYALTIEPGTQFGARHAKGRLPLCPDEEVARSFESLDRELEARGFAHYEISNYAKPGAQARHNLCYWRGGEYLGLGTGAWGTVAAAGRRIRYRTTPSPERYLALANRWATLDLDADNAGESERETIDAETALKERVMLGLRLAEGLDVGAAARDLGVEAFTAQRERAIARALREGRLAQDGERFWIPRDAWIVADGTIATLM